MDTRWTFHYLSKGKLAVNELWQVSIADGKARKLPIDLPVRQVRLHPDGRQMTFLSGDRTQEIWVMENFLPTLSAKK